MARRPTGTVTVPTAALHRALALVLHAAAKDEARPILSSVLFELRRKRGQPPVLRLVACDNYRIAWADIGPGAPADPTVTIGGTLRVDEWVMPLDGATQIHAMLGGAKASVTGTVAFAIDGDGTVAVGINGHSFRIPLRNGQYPNYARAMEDSWGKRKPKASIGVTGAYLADVAKAFAAKPARNGRIADQAAATLIVEWWDPLKPIRIATRGESDHGQLLMPVRVTG